MDNLTKLERDMLDNKQGMIFEEPLKLDPTQVVTFDESQKAEGLRIMAAAFEYVNNEFEDVLFRKTSRAAEEAMDQYKFTQNELHFIKKVQPNKVFFIRRLPSVHFVKLSSGKFINAETYVFRLESGLIGLKNQYDTQSDIIRHLKSEIDLISELNKKTTAFDCIKLAFKKLIGRE